MRQTKTSTPSSMFPRTAGPSSPSLPSRASMLLGVGTGGDPRLISFFSSPLPTLSISALVCGTATCNLKLVLAELRRKLWAPGRQAEERDIGQTGKRADAEDRG
eukprot:1149945-Rhodomonas_salina.2